VNPLDFKADLAIWTAVVFLLLLAVLWKFAWGPIAQGLDKREQGIADQIAQAERSNEEARRLLEEYQQKLADSEDEVRGIVEQGRRGAEQVGREIVEKARAEAQAEQQRSLREIETATAGALKELAERGAELAVRLAGKIVRAELKPADHTQLIEEAVSRFPKEKTGANGNPPTS
jgi:F-type H+-transporting ATPase subunit b